MSAPSSPLARWWTAARPRTLTLSLAPVLLGTTLGAQAAGRLAVLPFAAALLAAALIQIGTNLHNDAADFERGVDRAGRVGPPRATQAGWFTAGTVRRAAALCFLAALLVGAYLVWHGGWPILLLGLASLGAGYAYTGGRRPIAYGPLGEGFVLLFFGVAAVAGSAYLQALRLPPGALPAGVALGLPAAAVLLLNNYRDLEGDRAAGRRTLAHYLGRRRSRGLYAVLILSPLALAAAWLGPGRAAWLLLPALPVALWLTARLYRLPPGPALNPLLSATAAYALGLALLLSLSTLV